MPSGTWPFDTPGAVSYRCSIVTESASPDIFEIFSTKHIGSRPWPFRVTWRHVTSSVMRPIDSPMTFPVGGPLEPSLQLQPFSRYSSPKHVNEHTNTLTNTSTYTHQQTNQPINTKDRGTSWRRQLKIISETKFCGLGSQSLKYRLGPRGPQVYGLVNSARCTDEG